MGQAIRLARRSLTPIIYFKPFVLESVVTIKRFFLELHHCTHFLLINRLLSIGMHSVDVEITLIIETMLKISCSSLFFVRICA